jgi:hypothetical protein
MAKESSLPDPDFPHQLHGDPWPENDGYNLFGHGDPEGDMKRGKSKNWIFNDRRKK